MPGALEKSSMKWSRCVDGVLAGKCGMGCAHRTLTEPRQRNLASTLVLLRWSGGRRRGCTHRDATHVCRATAKQAAPPPARGTAKSPLPCRTARRTAYSRAHTTQPPYWATIPKFILRSWRNLLALLPSKDAPNPYATKRCLAIHFSDDTTSTRAALWSAPAANWIRTFKGIRSDVYANTIV